MLSFKLVFSLSFFTFIKRFFSSSKVWCHIVMSADSFYASPLLSLLPCPWESWEEAFLCCSGGRCKPEALLRMPGPSPSSGPRWGQNTHPVCFPALSGSDVITLLLFLSLRAKKKKKVRQEDICCTFFCRFSSSECQLDLSVYQPHHKSAPSKDIVYYS